MVLGTVAGLLYMTVSIAMIFINKQTMATYSLPNVLLFLQMVCAIVVVKALLALGKISFPQFCFTKAKLLLPVTLLYTANVGFGLMAVAALNVPVRHHGATHLDLGTQSMNNTDVQRAQTPHTRVYPRHQGMWRHANTVTNLHRHLHSLR